MYRNTWMEVNLTSLQNNIKEIQAIQNKKVIAICKANAYGLGDIQIAEAAMKAGCEMVAVSSLDEAIVLRKEGFYKDILILGYVEPNDIYTLKDLNIITTVPSLEWVKEVANSNCKGLRVHIKVNTGMNRLGLNGIEEVKEAVDILNNAKVNVEGIFTHYAKADEDDEFTTNQFNKFKDIVEKCNYEFKWIHASASEASIHFKEDFTNCIRLGIGMYGYSTYIKDLQTVLSLYSTITNIHHIKKDECVGYGATYKASKDEIIATIPIGYADGWLRKNQGRNVYIEGKEYEIVGRVCMDQMMVRVDQDFPIGTKVELFGDHISLERVAKELDTITYEVMTNLSDRLTKDYVTSDQGVIEEIIPRLERL